MTEIWDQLAHRAARTLSDEQREKLSRYLDLLLSANESMNLTRIDNRAHAELMHIGDALTLLKWLPSEKIDIADVGAGGGVPGIPLAIALPEAQVTLIESTTKKSLFLELTCAQLKLGNVRVLNRRAEDLAKAESFDVVTARALAAMDRLARWCLPLVRPGGRLLAMKGPKLAEELPLAEKTLRRLGASRWIVHPAELPGVANLVIVEVFKGLARG